MKPANFYADAADELRDACEWYEKQRPGLGDDLRNEVRLAVERIQKNPSAFARYGKEMRMHLVKRFPDTVYYLELEDAIWIVAVAHQKRRPGYWKRRKPD